jgi:hypothetical protein
MGTSSVSKYDSSPAVSVEDQAPLREISDGVGGQAYFANTAAELNDVLEYVLEFQPAVIHVKTANIDFMTGVPQ